MRLRNTTIDHDVLSRVNDALDTIKMYRMVAEHGIKFDNIDVDYMDEDSMFEYKITLIEEHSEIFNCPTDLVCVNCSDWDGSQYFPELCDWFKEDETGVYGLLFRSDKVMKYYKMCKEKNIDFQTTTFAELIDDARLTTAGCGDEYTYMEIFTPDDEFIENMEVPLVLFYTDASLLNYRMLENYYLAMEHVDAVLKGEEELTGREKKLKGENEK